MKKRSRTRRFIYIFEKRSDKFVRSFELKTFDLEELQKLFKQKSGDPMCYDYQITEKEAPHFRKKYGCRFHFGKREYFFSTRKG